MYRTLLTCRAYCHLLMVLDDEDFYALQSMFTVSNQRGIATALNTLVFRTHCPATPGEVQATPIMLQQRPVSALLWRSEADCVAPGRSFALGPFLLALR